MRQSYSEAAQWWENTGSPGLQEEDLPEDLTDDTIPPEAAGSEQLP
ncbi:hypothetical protein N5K55_21530 [Pseudomonas aeruginosa]|nr:hypothetical protein [Pseudomonas aeruginosa]